MGNNNNIIKKGLWAAAFLLPLSGGLKAQTAYEYLNRTNINAIFSADGQLFWDGKKANFEVPKGSGKNTISSSSLWIGGYDAQGALHEAAQTYRESGTDFWPGPLNLNTGKIDTATSVLYNKVWKVTKLEIDSFRSGLSTPKSILNWPGNGNSAKGFAAQLAPFVDLNGNGIYEPLKGEYPDILGDVMLWWVYNDATSYHNKTQSLPMNVEIQASAYTYNCPDDAILSNTIFIRYKVINRSSNVYSKVYLGQFADLDIGNIFDDYVGSDSLNNTFYAYNSTDLDKDTIITGKGYTYSYKGYGNVLPAQSVSFLKGINGDNGTEMPMSKFIFYNNEDNTPQGNPKTSNDFYNLLSGHWLNGAPLTKDGTGIGGTTAVNFAFAGIPGDHHSWNELAPHNTPGDRRGLGIFGPFTFSPGQTKEYTVAFGFHQAPGGKTLQSLQLMRDDINQLTRSFKLSALSACTGLPTCTVGDSCVWPGDASNDGKGYMDDLFRIGYAFGSKGPSRILASNSWKPQACQAWGKNFPDGENYKFADCNGDGVIDSTDVIALSMNYGLTHAKSGGSAPAAAGDPIMKIVFDQDTAIGGKTLSGKIYLGDSINPVNDVYGVALSLAFDPTIFDPNSFQFTLGNSDMGTLYELLALYKANGGKGIDISVSRNTQTGKKVKKIFIDFKLVIADNLAGYTKEEMKIENAFVVDSKLNPISINTQNGMIVLAQPTGIKYKDITGDVKLYPNPANNEIFVDMSRYTGAIIHITDMQGKEMKSIAASSDQKIIKINIADLPQGMYIMDINTPDGHAVKKFSTIR
jgi:hypothetical protein